MSKFELFRMKSFWGNYAFNYACSLSLGFSGGIISIWDPNYFVKERIWYDDNYVIVKGKCHEGAFGLFGDMIEVRFECERFDLMLDAPPRGHFHHWPIYLHDMNFDYGPNPFKLLHSWTNMDGFDALINGVIVVPEYLDKFELHDKLKVLKNAIKPWVEITRSGAHNRIHVVNERLKVIKTKVDDHSVMETELQERVNLMAELAALYDNEEKDVIQKAKVKWDVEGDDNSKFFHGLQKQRRCKQSISGVSLNGIWITDPPLVKNAFKEYYKFKFRREQLDGVFPNFSLEYWLSLDDNQLLEAPITELEIRTAAWNCGNEKSPGPDGFTFF
ncbi:uncharacterized protein [Rutidosis leptorrhynchoides]|uniref:uncharacterized protein n=1 Tax=Rutidosis leptorrhynchoides TaxID=125765 RepID=UPI003A996D55